MAGSQLSDAQRGFVNKYLSANVIDSAQANLADDGGWSKMHDVLAPQIEAALKANHPEASKIRAAWAIAVEKAEGGDHAAALKVGARLSAMLGASGADANPIDVPKDVVAFQKSRIMWIGAKRDMKSGLDAFRSAVMTQAADDEDLSEIAAATDALVEDFAAFDTALEDSLDAITQTAEGPDRTRLKKEASKAIETYLQALDGPFLSIVDNNPFVSVNVAARGRQCLSVIRATLA